MIQDYKKPTINGKYVFTASMVEGYFNNPKNFWQRLLQPDFELANFRTILGTVVHYCAEQYIKTGTIKESDCKDYIISKRKFMLDQEFNYVLNSYQEMATMLFAYFDKLTEKIESEIKLQTELTPNVVFAGTCDLMTSTAIVDIKTISQFSEVQFIPPNYRTQLLGYKYLAEKNGKNIQDLGCLYVTTPRHGEVGKTGKLLKDYPSNIYYVHADYIDEQIEEFNNKLFLIANAIELYHRSNKTDKEIISYQMKVKEEKQMT